MSPAPETDETDRTRWALVALLWVAGLFAAMQFAKVALSLPALAEAYPGRPVAFAVSGVAVMGVLFGTVAGAVVARIGAPRAIPLALGLSALAGAGQALLPPFAVLMALRVVEGAGHLALVVALPTLMASVAAPGMRPVVMGLWATFFGVGFAVAALALPLLPGPGAVFALHAGGMAVLFLVLGPALRGEPAPGPGPAGRRPGLSEAYRRLPLTVPGIGHGIYASQFIGLVTFLPLALSAPWLAAVLPLVGIVGSFAAGFLARRVAPGRLVPAGFAAMAVLFAGAALVPGPPSVALALAAMLASGVVAGGGFAAVPWLNADSGDRARANGVVAQLGNVGTFCSVPAFAALGPGGALPGAALVAGAAALVMLPLYAGAMRSRGPATAAG